jgi:hypothetical protein
MQNVYIMKSKLLLIAPALALLMTACNTPARVENYGMGLAPIDLCDQYQITSSQGDKLANIYADVISKRKVDCSQFREALDIRANTRFLATVIGG